MCARVCQCDVMIEQYEEVIEDWYKGSQEEDLTTYLCEKHVLKGHETGNAQIQRSSVFCIFTLFLSNFFFPASFPSSFVSFSFLLSFGERDYQIQYSAIL